MAVSKRVQVLLRDRVHEIVQAIAEDENLSMSRVCSYWWKRHLLHVVRSPRPVICGMSCHLTRLGTRSLVRTLLAHAAQQGIEVHVDQVNTRKPETDIAQMT